MSKLRPTWVIFKYTFIEAVRSRLFYVLLILAALVLGMIGLITSFKFGVHVKFLKDFSYSLISIAGLFLTLFISYDKLSREIEETTIYAILSRPVPVSSFIAGKFLATLLIIAINIIALGIMVGLVLYYYSGAVESLFLLGVVLLLFKLSILISMLFLFSLVISQALALPLALFIYLYGHVGILIKEKFFTVFGLAGNYVLKFIDIVIPNYIYFDLEGNVVHNYSVPAGYIALVVIYSLVLSIFFLYLSKIILENRDL